MADLMIRLLSVDWGAVSFVVFVLLFLALILSQGEEE